MEPSIPLNLRPYKTSREMWEYLKKIYNQSNTPRRFLLELELGQLSQGSMSIQGFYSSFGNLWADYTDIVYGSVEPSILLNLRPCKTSREMWEYLKKIYNQSNTARRFQLELE